MKSVVWTRSTLLPAPIHWEQESESHPVGSPTAYTSTK